MVAHSASGVPCTGTNATTSPTAMTARAASSPAVPPTPNRNPSPATTPPAAATSDGPVMPSSTPRCSSGPNSTVSSSLLIAGHLASPDCRDVRVARLVAAAAGGSGGPLLVLDGWLPMPGRCTPPTAAVGRTTALRPPTPAATAPPASGPPFMVAVRTAARRRFASSTRIPVDTGCSGAAIGGAGVAAVHGRVHLQLHERQQLEQQPRQPRGDEHAGRARRGRWPTRCSAAGR